MDEFTAEIERLTEEYARQAARVKQAYGELNELEVTAESGDGLVAVTVGGRGQVRGIELNPRVYRKVSPSELAESIMELIDRATDTVTERSRELLGPLVPDGVPYEELFGPGADLDALLPNPGDA
ncbi:YbaB/EbfC family nucleoid-associated protein [Nonomuraea sp. NPDC050536]|uniref:YbaB/EbfC family nucleoid-associated protein n=1 Tax=Nonomuraea sp. NPDC050536 TaxID=3364366 RepID=UPI0037C64393